MTHITCRLTVKNWDQLWNPTLGNRVWATFTFFYLNPTRLSSYFNQPLYLTHLLAPYTRDRCLRSHDKHLLLEPAVSTITGSRRFSYAAPSVWNKLPLCIRNSSSFAFFESHRMTCYFPVPSVRPTTHHLSP